MNQYVSTTDSPSFVNVYATSDERLKADIRVIEHALAKVAELRGVTYKRISTGKTESGVIAQDLLKVIPELVIEGEDGYLSVAYGNIVGLLIEAVKELADRVDKLEK
jgi:transketolase C-terminal domain/subunit